MFESKDTFILIMCLIGLFFITNGHIALCFHRLEEKLRSGMADGKSQMAKGENPIKPY
jgi:hypothetical protein